MRREPDSTKRRKLPASGGEEGPPGRRRSRKAELGAAVAEAYRQLAQTPAAFRSLTRKDFVRLAGALSRRFRNRIGATRLLEALLAKWAAWCASEGGQEAVEAARYGLAPSPEAREPHEALPSGYGKTRLVLLPIDPHRVHAYWEVVPADLEAAGRALGKGGGSAETILRIYDVTAVIFDGTNAWHTFDVTVGAAANWYLDLWSPEKSLLAEVGLRGPSGRFVPLARSNVVHTPRAGPSDRWEERWVEVRRAAAAGTEGVLPRPPSAAPHVAVPEDAVGAERRGLPPGPQASAEEAPAGAGEASTWAAGETEGGSETPGLAAWRRLQATWTTSPAVPPPPSHER